MSAPGFIPISRGIPYWPNDLFGQPRFLDEIGLREFEVHEGNNTLSISGVLLWYREIILDLPLLSGFSIALLNEGNHTAIQFELDILPSLNLRLQNLNVSFRMDTNLLRPVRRENDQWIRVVDANGNPRFVELRLSNVGITVDINGNIEVVMPAGAPQISLGAVEIGDTGIILEINNVSPYFSTEQRPSPHGAPPGFRGIIIQSINLHLPDKMDVPLIPSDLRFEHLLIGTGGFSGTIRGNWHPTFDVPSRVYSGRGSGRLFGIPFGLRSFEVVFAQNTITRSSIQGDLVLPFFNQPIGVDVGLGSNGNFTVALSSTQPNGVHQSGRPGVVSFEKEGLLSMTIERLAFQLQEEVFSIKLGGQVRPLFGHTEGLEWPSFQIEELMVDSEGNVRLEGGWLNLREQYTFNLYGFKIEITKLGFGQIEDGGKWIGFSGAVKLVDGIQAGASVEGLRIIWYDDGRSMLTLNGVGIEFEVPNVLSFKGAVSYDGLNNKFTGNIKLHLISLNLEVDAKLIFGTSDGPQGQYTYFAIYLNAELPAGIPLFSTGLALYGMAGLFAAEMEPNKLPDDQWYGIDRSHSWYHRGNIGVTDIINKWRPQHGSIALGAGITIGTISDNGFKFSGKVLFAIVFPGPILLIEGKANLLKERAKLDAVEPIFRALAVLDNRAGTFLIGLDAQYKYDSDGKLIDIRGSAEAFYSFSDPSAWHIYLGEKDPQERRIRAKLFNLFDANAYLMLDANRLALGARVGYDGHWSYGPIDVSIGAWIEGNAIVSWKPTHFYGDLWLHGNVALRVFGFGLGLTADARIAADIFDPFHVKAGLSVSVDLPWPLPDFSTDVSLEWGPIPTPPPLPLPLQEIAIEHFKVTTSWPLQCSNNLLVPNYDQGDGFYREMTAIPDPAAPPPANASLPVVPLDCRPHITFRRPVRDEANVGINPQLVRPERIGDPVKDQGPAKVQYSLKEIVLHKRVGGAWQLKSVSPNQHGEPKLFGSWAPIPNLSDNRGTDVAQTKLWLWSKTPFDYTRHTGSNWDGWFTNRLKDYPCVVIPAAKDKCYDFKNVDKSKKISSQSWSHPDNKDLKFSWSIKEEDLGLPSIRSITDQSENQFEALCFVSHYDKQVNDVTIDLPEPMIEVTILFVESEGIEIKGYDDSGEKISYGTFVSHDDGSEIKVTGDHMNKIVIHSNTGMDMCLLKICMFPRQVADDITNSQILNQHLADEIAHWSQLGEVLEPHSTYRLKVTTTIKPEEFVDSSFNRERTVIEYAYFRTEGAPGLTNLSVPINISNRQQEFSSGGLDNLTPYVSQTIPATVPSAGKKPELPRPVYCAYDVGIEFNENYVELMYRLDRRDLGLYLYDNNNQPVRDTQDRIVFVSNHWGQLDHLELSEGEIRWISMMNSSNCTKVIFNPQQIPHSNTLISAAVNQVLEMDTIYEARLIPLLLHEDFRSFTLNSDINAGPTGSGGGWIVVDQGSNNRPSRWEIHKEDGTESRFILQTSRIWGGTSGDTDLIKPGTLLIYINNLSTPNQAVSWTNYRFSTFVRSTDNNAIGIVFRYQNPNNYYRFSIDNEEKYRRLVKVSNGVPTRLAEDHFVYTRNRDYLITVEATGSSIRLYQDGSLIFGVNDVSIDHGSIGLYSWKNSGARFTDLRVDDLRAEAPVVYRFKFTTSKFANFFHQMHTFQDETWSAAVTAQTSASAISNLVDRAVDTSMPVMAASPSDSEAHSYEFLEQSITQGMIQKNVTEVQIAKIMRDSNPFAILVQNPEPIDWERVSLDVRFNSLSTLLPEPPLNLKLTDVNFGIAPQYNDSVTMLVRETTDLTGYRIEYRRLPGPILDRTNDPILLSDNFNNALTVDASGHIGQWYVIDEGAERILSRWEMSQSELTQSSDVGGGTVPGYPGTYLLAGDEAWTDYKLVVTLTSKTDAGAIGVIFRYKDADNYYRFSMDRRQRYRRLIKKAAGSVEVLREDDQRYEVQHDYTLTVNCIGKRLSVYFDSVLLFDVEDNEIPSGRIGLYCWGKPTAIFKNVRVYGLDWRLYYQFKSEPKLSAGTRVRIYGDSSMTNRADQHDHDVVVKQFISTAEGTNRILIPADGVDLRIVSPDGKPGHNRQFLPENNFSTLNPKLIRKADGTAFFIFVPLTSSPLHSQLASGQYRLEMTYRRNNRIVNSNSQVFTQARNSNPELVTIDIPWT
jgi:hypothetical protein